MANGRINDFYKQYEQLVEKFEKQEKLLKDTNKLVSTLNKTIESLNQTIENLQNKIIEKDKEILRLKLKNDKDSNDSSKPSSTNGYKKVITNRREKSTKSKGGQKGHEAHSLNNKLEQFINSGNIEEEIIEIGKTNVNKCKRFIEKTVIDIKIIKSLKRYRYYPYEDGKYYIPSRHNQYVQYGNNLKAICSDLMINLYNSTDGVTRFIEDITNGGITLSKGTLDLWLTKLNENLISEIIKIETSLLDSYYLNNDESQIKINGEQYNTICACNNTHTRLWISKHKSKAALKEIGFLSLYQGIIVKDGTELYNEFGIGHAQCLSHILRYLVDYYDKIPTPHKAPKKLSNFLSNCNNTRNVLISKGIKNFTIEELNSLISEYDNIINEWEIEIRNDTTNPLINDEICLWTRMKYDNKKMNEDIRGDRDEILYFLKDFNIPSTNNQAEVDQRNIKIKQKIGKFRSLYGAENYAIIRSCINTYKKNAVNVLKSLTQAFLNNPILV